MAKTKHNHMLDSIDEIITDGKKKGVLHLYAEDEILTGRKLVIDSRDHYHFGTTSYLGLDQDIRLKQAAVDAIWKYGTQFPLSKTYISFNIYKELEENLRIMYDNPVLVCKNSTLAHIAVIPSVVRDEDAIIIDHQVHWSVQNACQLVKPRGIPVEIIRHNNMQMLEEKISELGQKYNKIWYMVDGVYSMFGDCTPIHELVVLLDKYPQLHLYVDDVHGMSWAGKHGTGYVMGQVGKLHEKMLLVATLSKSFGASGGIAVFPDHELYRKVKTFGGPQTFSAQLEPPMVAAALASTKIHLSDEIYTMQNELADKINYCNSLLSQTNLPLVEENKTPIFFIGTGLPATGYNLVARIMKEGFYVNMGVFPAVPVKNTGVRFTISRHNHQEDINQLIQAINYHYPKAIQEENRTQNSVRKAFNLPLLAETATQTDNSEPKIHLQRATTIEALNQVEWDTLMGANGCFDYRALQLLEKAFRDNSLPEHNYDFYYYIVRDKKQAPILVTFFTATLWKEDLLSSAAISRLLEEKRKINPYYLTSKALSMGTSLTEGRHYFLDKEHPQWKAALLQLLDALAIEQETANVSRIILRDFEDNDPELKNFIINQGYFKIDMPDTGIIDELKWENSDELINQTPIKINRYKLRKEVQQYENYFDVEIKHQITKQELPHLYQLYMNVKGKNLDLNLFDYPEKLFQMMSGSPGFEFIILKLKEEYNDQTIQLPVSVIFSYRNTNNDYIPLLIGMNYDYLEKYHLYRQTLFQMLKHAKKINSKRVYLGFSATFEKKKLGARIIPKIAFVQSKDNFTLELIESMAVSSSNMKLVS